jgi:hypothetical protein
LQSFFAGAEYFRGVSRGRAPHNPEVKGTPPRSGQGGAGSVIATR